MNPLQFESKIDMATIGSEIKIPLRGRNRMTLHVQGTGQTVSGEMSLRKSNREDGRDAQAYPQVSAPTTFSGVGFYPSAGGTYDMSGVYTAVLRVTTAGAGVFLVSVFAYEEA